MKTIYFSEVGVAVKSIEELDEIYLTYTALDIAFGDRFKNDCIDAQQHNLVGYFIQSTRGDLKTTLDGSDLYVSIFKYPVKYLIDKLDFAVAYQLLKTNQEGELLAHLNKYCKEYSHV